MTISLKHDTGALILFDFKVAFPSLSHPFLTHCLSCLGLPDSALNFSRALYHQNICHIRIKGCDFPGFECKGGVRHCCPLSPLLFAVCVDILLRMLAKRVPDLKGRAFADDIGALVTDWFAHAPIVMNVFNEIR